MKEVMETTETVHPDQPEVGDVFSPGMNAKRNSIDTATMSRPSAHVRCLVGPVAYDVSVRIVRTQSAPPPASTRPSIALRAAGNYCREFWETLSYAVMWLCGLIGITLC